MNGVPWWYLQSFGGPLKGQRLESVDRGGGSRRQSPRSAFWDWWCAPRARCPNRPGAPREWHARDRREVVGSNAGQMRGQMRGQRPCRRPALRGIRAHDARTGFQCDVTAEIHHEYWMKVVGNLSFNTVSTLTGAWTDWLIDTAGTRALCANLIAEAFEIGRKLGLEIEQAPRRASPKRAPWATSRPRCSRTPREASRSRSRRSSA